jgi:hypothetical protein
MPDEQSVDIFNEPSFLAANRAFEQIQSFLKRMPNPPGYSAKKSQLTAADIQRLIKGD